MRFPSEMWIIQSPLLVKIKLKVKMNNQDLMKELLLKELKEKFNESKKKLGFKSSFEEINDIFFINDFIIYERHVSEFFSRQLCRRIVDVYNSWTGYLHGLMMPTPGNFLMMMENRMLGEEDKKKISEIIKKILSLSSMNTLIIFNKNKKDEAKFIDESVKFWKENFQPEMKKIMEKINKGWRDAK